MEGPQVLHNHRHSEMRNHQMALLFLPLLIFSLILILANFLLRPGETKQAKTIEVQTVLGVEAQE